jgi:hypothetical protein
LLLLLLLQVSSVEPFFVFCMQLSACDRLSQL